MHKSNIDHQSYLIFNFSVKIKLFKNIFQQINHSSFLVFEVSLLPLLQHFDFLFNCYPVFVVFNSTNYFTEFSHLLINLLNVPVADWVHKMDKGLYFIVLRGIIHRHNIFKIPRKVVFPN